MLSFRLSLYQQYFIFLAISRSRLQLLYYYAFLKMTLLKILFLYWPGQKCHGHCEISYFSPINKMMNSLKMISRLFVQAYFCATIMFRLSDDFAAGYILRVIYWKKRTYSDINDYDVYFIHYAAISHALWRHLFRRSDWHQLSTYIS